MLRRRRTGSIRLAALTTAFTAPCPDTLVAVALAAAGAAPPSLPNLHCKTTSTCAFRDGPIPGNNVSSPRNAARIPAPDGATLAALVLVVISAPTRCRPGQR